MGSGPGPPRGSRPHGPAALVEVELVVDQHRGREVVSLRQLGHQTMRPRLGARERRAGIRRREY